MTTAPAPLTQAALRSHLWDGGAAEPTGVAAPPDVDDLTLAKMRLLDLRRPAPTTLAAMARNPIPWTIAALVAGAILGRSRMVRAAAAWVGTRLVMRTLRQTARHLASRNGGSRNGRRRGRAGA